MPGGSGIRAANYIDKMAPPDGTCLSMIGQTLPLGRMLGFTICLEVDVSSFGWIAI
jgi:hypothetical protein